MYIVVYHFDHSNQFTNAYYIKYLFIWQIFVSPPLHRRQPYWYRDYFTLIMSSYSRVFSTCPERIILLPPFDCAATSFMADGIHLSQGEGER